MSAPGEAARRSDQALTRAASLEPAKGDVVRFGAFEFDGARVLRFCVIGLFLYATIWALEETRAVTMPLAAGAILGLILGPAADRMAAYGVPKFIGYTLIIAMVVGVVTTFFLALYPAVADWITRAPEFMAAMRERFSFVQRAVERLSSLTGGGAEAVVVEMKDSSKLLTALATTITPAFSQAVIFIFALIFFLAGRSHFRNRIVLFFAGRDQRLVAIRAFNTIESGLLRYFATIALINAGLGLLTGLAMYLVGMPQPVIWGMLAFLLNFLPLVGPLMLKGVLAAAGLALMPDLASGVLPVGVYLILVTVEANFITPVTVGKRFLVNPFLVFISVICWTWLWGVFGAFLAMPIAVVAATIYDAVREAEKVHLPG